MMADRESVEVTVEIGGQEVVAGTRWIHEQRAETATFRYSDSSLASPASYDLDPALPKSAGVFQSRPGKPLFSAFTDSAPDRWGQNLMRREARELAAAESRTPRSLRHGDFLLGVRDDTRQGAIRFRHPGTRDPAGRLTSWPERSRNAIER
jgi:serine/threonine-protein kinase HipA